MNNTDKETLRTRVLSDEERAALFAHAVEELLQLGYSVRDDGLLYPPENLAALLAASEQPAEPPQSALERYDATVANYAKVAQPTESAAQAEPVALQDAFRAAWKKEVGSGSNTAGRDVALRVAIAAIAASPRTTLPPQIAEDVRVMQRGFGGVFGLLLPPADVERLSRLVDFVASLGKEA